MLKIVVLDGYTLNPGDNPWDEVAALGELVVHDHSLPGEVVARCHDAAIVLTNKTVITRDMIAQLPNIKFIGVLATGFNIVDIDAARERGIPVSNVPEYSTRSVAQFVMALMLDFCHRVADHSRAVHAGRWVASRDFSFWDSPLEELTGKTLGIIGFGRIGQETGRLARAFGMEVLAHSRSRSQNPGYPFCWGTVEELFENADFVSLHCPLTPDNTGMVNAGLLSRMKPGAVLINTARGPLVVEADLAEALRQGTIAGAAVDVVSKEPMTNDNPLLGAPNLIITPHIAWATRTARLNLMRSTAENIRAFLAGTPINVVNPANGG